MTEQEETANEQRARSMRVFEQYDLASVLISPDQCAEHIEKIMLAADASPIDDPLVPLGMLMLAGSYRIAVAQVPRAEQKRVFSDAQLRTLATLLEPHDIAMLLNLLAMNVFIAAAELKKDDDQEANAPQKDTI